jgi:ABC-2 type transport system ATP-binding protein
MKMPILEIQNLAKNFGSLRAVDGLSFSLYPGECLGLLGPNGAGKTTTLSLITGIVTPDAGAVLIEGRRIESDIDPIKRSIGVVPQDLALYEELSALDNLKFFGALYSLNGTELGRSIDEALSLVGLADRAKDKVKTFSGGMKRRLNIAAALLHDPQLLLLDEPTVGVDPQSRHAIFENIAALRARGKTVLYTTHYMEEVERLCDRIVIMDHGRVIADDTIETLKRRMAKGCRLRLELADTGAASLQSELRSVAGVQSVGMEANRLTIGLDDLTQRMPAVLGLLSQRGQTIMHVESERPDLESIFLTLTGNKLRDL